MGLTIPSFFDIKEYMHYAPGYSIYIHSPVRASGTGVRRLAARREAWHYHPPPRPARRAGCSPAQRGLSALIARLQFTLPNVFAINITSFPALQALCAQQATSASGYSLRNNLFNQGLNRPIGINQAQRPIRSIFRITTAGVIGQRGNAPPSTSTQSPAPSRSPLRAIHQAARLHLLEHHATPLQQRSIVEHQRVALLPARANGSLLQEVHPAFSIAARTLIYRPWRSKQTDTARSGARIIPGAQPIAIYAWNNIESHSNRRRTDFQRIARGNIRLLVASCRPNRRCSHAP